MTKQPPTSIRILIPLAMLTLLVWLAKTSRAEGYDIAEVERLNQIAGCNGVADVWQLCDEDLSKPVVLWREK